MSPPKIMDYFLLKITKMDSYLLKIAMMDSCPLTILIMDKYLLKKAKIDSYLLKIAMMDSCLLMISMMDSYLLKIEMIFSSSKDTNDEFASPAVLNTAITKSYDLLQTAMMVFLFSGDHNNDELLPSEDSNVEFIFSK